VVEHYNDTVGVTGSNPVPPTISLSLDLSIGPTPFARLTDPKCDGHIKVLPFWITEGHINLPDYLVGALGVPELCLFISVN
jgi:hypothetical protein